MAIVSKFNLIGVEISAVFFSILKEGISISLEISDKIKTVLFFSKRWVLLKTCFPL